MIFDMLSAKKTDESLEQKKEMERAWAMYGQEVEDFLKSANLKGEFERLEKSKYVTRPGLKLQVIREQDTPLSDDLKLRIKRGEIQESKAYRFMLDPALRAMLEREEPPPPRDIQLSEDIKQRVSRGEIQGSKACRFMTDPALRAMLPQ